MLLLLFGRQGIALAQDDTGSADIQRTFTILRQYMLAHYTLPQLAQMANTLGLDWEQLGSGSKKEKIRALLLYLMRRNRLAELIHLMHDPALISS